MSYFTLKNGEQIYYEDTGKGTQTIVMLHGWSSSHEVFAPSVPAISTEARCIVYDHRGHGNSKNANREKVTMDTLCRVLCSLLIWLPGIKKMCILLTGLSRLRTAPTCWSRNIRNSLRTRSSVS